MKIYKQHKVSGRRGLARKLGVELRTDEDIRVDEIRTQIQQLRRTGVTKMQVAKEMGLTFSAVCHHIKASRRQCLVRT
jgi:hypothetical protein